MRKNNTTLYMDETYRRRYYKNKSDIYEIFMVIGVLVIQVRILCFCCYIVALCFFSFSNGVEEHEVQEQKINNFTRISRNKCI